MHLRGKWTLDARLGVGGMATVYAATHRNGGRAAIKILHPELAAMREIRNRFVREGYLANKVGHPAVVRALDDDTDDDGTPFLVMELVEGETLADRFAEEVMNAEELLAVAEQVLPALVAGHTRGVIHQDLKPTNLLVDNDGRVRILDYGIARVIDDGDATRFKIRATGTPSFMSPELVRGEVGDEASDIYALGATLFALATGRPPHVAETSTHLMIRIATERAPKLATLAPELPREICELVDGALHIHPDRRWPTAQTMLNEVRRIREVLRIPTSTLTLACRHVATLPQLPKTTDSVRAIVVSAPPRRSEAPPPQKKVSVVALAAVAIAIVACGLALRTRIQPVARVTPPVVAAAPPPVQAPAPIVVAEPAPTPSASTSAKVEPAKKKAAPRPTPAMPAAYKDSPY